MRTDRPRRRCGDGASQGDSLHAAVGMRHHGAVAAADHGGVDDATRRRFVPSDLRPQPRALVTGCAVAGVGRLARDVYDVAEGASALHHEVVGVGAGRVDSITIVGPLALRDHLSGHGARRCHHVDGAAAGAVVGESRRGVTAEADGFAHAQGDGAVFPLHARSAPFGVRRWAHLHPAADTAGVEVG